MGKNLVIVESPAKAKTIKKYLGSNYIVEASMGHIRDLPKSTLGVDIENDYTPKYITIRGKGDLLASLKKSAKKASKVYLATDPDREGEAISWHLMNSLGIDDKSKCRIEFNEITKVAIKNAVKNPRQVNIPLVDAQQARRILDRLVGYQISPILWKKVKWGLSAGRVQSITLKIICDREREIQSFEPEEYWTIDIDINKGKKIVNFKLTLENGKKIELKNKDDADKVIKAIKNKKAQVVSVKKQDRIKKPIAPFTTSTLQQESYKKLNFTTKRTMSVAQVLYEGFDVDGFGTVSLITYMRTDSVRISDEARDNAKEFIVNNYGNEYYPEKPNVYLGKKASQDAHEAVRPSHIEIDPSMIKGKVKPELYKLYNLIWTRFMASQMAPARVEATSILLNIENYGFRVSGNVTKFDGWMKLYELENDEDKTLPVFEENEMLNVEKIKDQQHFTQAPARFTEGSLVKILEENGIGRPSTYSPTISTILARRYVEKENKSLCPTELGFIVENIMCEYFTQIMNVEFTADMEAELDQIEMGELKWKEVIHKYFEPIMKEVEIAEKELAKISIEDKVSDVPCDKCGTMMVIKQSRYGDFLACPNYPECKNTKSLARKLEVPCPVCGGEIFEKKSKKGRTFYGCGNYPECKFVSWGEPTNEKCEKCGSIMTKKYTKAKGDFLECSNAECKNRKIKEE